jgi:hypothetical protein
MYKSKAGEVSLARGTASLPLGFVLGFLDLPEANQHQAYIDGIGGDANDAEVKEHEEQDPGQVDRSSQRHKGTQHKQDRGPANPQTTCKAKN